MMNGLERKRFLISARDVEKSLGRARFRSPIFRGNDQAMRDEKGTSENRDERFTRANLI